MIWNPSLDDLGSTHFSSYTCAIFYYKCVLSVKIEHKDISLECAKRNLARGTLMR
jgi:hypothetical protein